MIERIVDEVASRYGLQDPSYYVHPSRHDDPITALVKSGGKLVCVVRFGREKKHNAHIEDVFENLREIKSKLHDTSQRTTIPEPIYTSCANDIRYLVKSP